MSDDIEDCVESVSGSKIRKQSAHELPESDSTRENGCSSGSNVGRCVSNAESSCGSSVNNLNSSNGSTMNNLNSCTISNGYSTRFGEGSRDQRNGQSYTTRYRQMYNSSSSEDDDEHCVYTYKGAEVGSDLPESFLCLGMNVPNNGARNSLCSSPDMDFLEMDFDPGPSNGQDSDSDNNTSFVRNISPDGHVLAEVPRPSSIGMLTADEEVLVSCDENANCFGKLSVVSVDEKFATPHVFFDPEIPCCSKSLAENISENRRTSLGSDSEHPASNAPNDGEPSNNEIANVTVNSYNSDDFIEYSSEDELPCDKPSTVDFNVCPRKLSEDSDKEENIFIPDACPKNCYENQNNTLSTNIFDISLLNLDSEEYLNCFDDLLPVDPSYSISAFINVIKLLRIFDYSSVSQEALVNLLQHKQIPENVSLVEYLYMRAVQNANENDLANFSSTVFHSKLHSRFFSTYPKTDVNLLEWLNIWMRRGAVPVVTRNIQERGTLTTKNLDRNPWRHNVVYKLESSYLYLSNPIEKISESSLHSQLSQAPLIFVKRTSVLKRWTSKVDLRALVRANHNRWYNENVLGQVATIIREHNNGLRNTQYVRIPSNCNCGITLFVPSDDPALCKEIDEALELPFVCC